MNFSHSLIFLCKKFQIIFLFSFKIKKISLIPIKIFLMYNKCMRIAEIKDLDEIMIIINDGKKALKKDGIDQWQNGLPDRGGILENILTGESFVYEENGEILSFAYLKKAYEKDYREIEKDFKKHKSFITIHRLSVRESAKKKGVARKFFDEIIGYGKNLKIEAIRIDTHPDNFKMQNLIRKFSFEKVGICTVDDKIRRSKRFVYELVL